MHKTTTTANASSPTNPATIYREIISELWEGKKNEEGKAKPEDALHLNYDFGNIIYFQMQGKQSKFEDRGVTIHSKESESPNEKT